MPSYHERDCRLQQIALIRITGIHMTWRHTTPHHIVLLCYLTVDEYSRGSNGRKCDSQNSPLDGSNESQLRIFEKDHHNYALVTATSLSLCFNCWSILSICTRTCMVGASSILIPCGDKVASNKCGLITAARGSQKEVGFLSADPDNEVAGIVDSWDFNQHDVTGMTPHPRDVTELLNHFRTTNCTQQPMYLSGAWRETIPSLRSRARVGGYIASM